MNFSRIRQAFLIGAIASVTGAIFVTSAGYAAGFTGTVTIVHINDVHANVAETDKQIGYAKIAGFVEQTRAANPNTLFLDAGDVIAGNPYASIDRGLGFVPILNTLGLNAMTAGNSEFAYGSEHLRKFADGLNYPLLVDNMVSRETGKPLSEGYTLVELPNGLTAGIIGITTYQSGLMASTDLEYTDGVAAAQRLVLEARDAGADFVVGLFHVGELEEKLNSQMIIDAAKGIDVVIDGHSHTGHPNGLEHNGVIIAQTSGNGETVGLVDLAFVDGRISGTTARLLDRAAFDDVPDKADTRSAVDAFLLTANAFFDEVIGETTVTLEGTRDIVRTQETNLGNLFTDAIREASDAQLAFLPAGYIGGHIEPGPIDRRTIQTIARIEVEIAKVELTGAQLVSFVNSTIDTFPEPSGSLLHVSGGTYKIDPDADEVKVHSFTVGGEPLDPDKTYSTAVVVGALTRPGISEGKVLSRHGTTPEILEAYVKAHSPVSPQSEGRFGAEPTAN